MVEMTSADRKAWSTFAGAMFRGARDVAALGFLQEPDSLALVPEGERPRVVVTVLPEEGTIRLYLRLPSSPGEAQTMTHLGDLHESGEWKTGTQRITPKGPAH
jgi:hypothetical protein